MNSSRTLHIVSFSPHMHLRGKDIFYRAIYPDGRSEILLSVPRYDFNWQVYYYPAKPIAVCRRGRGSKSWRTSITRQGTRSIPTRRKQSVSASRPGTR